MVIKKFLTTYISTGVYSNRYILEADKFYNKFADEAREARKHPELLEANDKEINEAIDREEELEKIDKQYIRKGRAENY